MHHEGCGTPSLYPDLPRPFMQKIRLLLYSDYFSSMTHLVTLFQVDTIQAKHALIKLGVFYLKIYYNCDLLFSRALSNNADFCVSLKSYMTSISLHVHVSPAFF